MQLDWFTFTAQIINFAILLVLLKRFLYNPIVQAMDRREKEIQERIENVRFTMQQAEEKEAEYKQKISAFERQKEEMRVHANEEIEQIRKEMLEKARKEVKEIQNRWNEAIEEEQQTFIQQLYIEAGDRIVGLLRIILSDLSDKDLEEQVVESFMSRLASIDPNEMQNLTKSALEYGEGIIQVKSSFPLGEESERAIREILSEVTAPDINCRFEVVPSLKIGIEVSTGGWKIGWNLESYLARLREGMEEYLQQNIRSSTVAGPK